MGNIIETLKNLEEFESLKAATAKEVEEAEQKLSTKFADDYKKYLLTFGIVSAGGHEFTGIVKSARLNVCDVTSKIRAKYENISNDLYVIEELGIDGIVALQNANAEIFLCLPNSDLVKVADSFVEYIQCDSKSLIENNKIV